MLSLSTINSNTHLQFAVEGISANSRDFFQTLLWLNYCVLSLVCKITRYKVINPIAIKLNVQSCSLYNTNFFLPYKAYKLQV